MVAVSVALAVTCAAGSAQGPRDSTSAGIDDRPKIGLVLGGGGAKGGAHIGVLEVLEELRIPIDYIAGTSIGSAIGGLYASGMSVPELRALMESLDWQDVLSNRAPRRHRPIRIKQSDDRTPTRFEVGFNGGAFRLPTGIVTGQNVERTLRSATLSVAQIQTFEDLAIPFVAVATDLVTGEMVTIDHGNLFTAIQASMSLPGVFSPVEVDGRTLVDGVVVRNLPVDVVREMGADVVIAVDLTPPLYDAEDLKTAIEITAQASRIGAIRSTRPQRESLTAGHDVLLRPDVEDVTVIDFRSLVGTISKGSEVARDSAEALGRFSVDADTYVTIQERRETATGRPDRLDFVRIEGTERIDPEVLRRRMNLSLGAPLTADRLERALSRVFAMELYERVDYTLVEDGGRHGLLIEVTEKPWGPGFLRFGVAFSDDLEQGESSLALSVSHVQTQLNRRGGELLTELRIFGAGLAAVELFQPLDKGGRFFVSPRLEYQLESLDVTYFGAGQAHRDVEEFTASMALGVQFPDWGEWRVEVARGRVWEKGSGGGGLDARVGGVSSRFTVDVLDDRSFPRSGVWAFFEAYRSERSLGASLEYTRLEGAFLAAFSRGRNTVLLGGRAGSAIDSTLPVHHDFALGGLQRMSGLLARDILGNHYGFARVTFQTRLATLTTALQGGDLYVGFSLEGGNAWDDMPSVRLDDLSGAASVFAGVETLFGPLFLSYGRTWSGEDKIYLLLGRAL
jgi:NTE family protein